MIVIMTLGNAEIYPETREAAERLRANGWTLEHGAIEELPKSRSACRETPEGYMQLYEELQRRPDLAQIFSRLVKMDEASKDAVIRMIMARSAGRETREAKLKNGVAEEVKTQAGF